MKDNNGYGDFFYIRFVCVGFILILTCDHTFSSYCYVTATENKTTSKKAVSKNKILFRKKQIIQVIIMIKFTIPYSFKSRK